MFQVILKSGKDASVRRFHPWVFSGAIKKIKNEDGKESDPQEGDIVKVTDNKGEFLGIGHYQNGSIMVRIISFQEIEINEDFWTNRIQEAYDLRTQLQLTNNNQTNIYRLIHAEGDGLPGLIIDYYAGTAVIQSRNALRQRQYCCLTKKYLR